MADDPQDETNLDAEQLKEMLAKLAEQDPAKGAQPRDREGEGWIDPRPADMQHLSPTLVSLDPKRRPNPEPVCVVCPKSMWLSQAATLKCFCRLMHAVTWDSEDPQPVLTCDGAMMPD